MSASVLVLNAHPDPAPERLCAALADAYAGGAEAAGHGVARLGLAGLDFPMLDGAESFRRRAPPPAIAAAQEAIEAATHLCIVFPIWLGGPPALLHGFLEQTLRPDFVLGPGAEAPTPFGKRRLAGRSVRLVATMAMPQLAYRLWYLGRGVGAMRQGALGFSGFGPVRVSMIGSAEALSRRRAARLLARMRALGARPG
ncbi:NAD(P)H-dependent oxidoreductase [Rubrimonas cliftonensis]|uniref:Putative NADPH-quinone reductase (Modulator of drug activity B) n=1 Tax=Rubrimonas cliftonensis TaxID=89524 RepID=A0A1H4A1Z5_9RHOB|nr:NAD(P)H-dependent oxidoreductase [Rubrimonas cliftonensis]SEA29641.1 Putative NADPH-quinone reductase (modulator of drug activity B) [Rubrimonas cliftonensis]